MTTQRRNRVVIVDDVFDLKTDISGHVSPLRWGIQPVGQSMDNRHGWHVMLHTSGGLLVLHTLWVSTEQAHLPEICGVMPQRSDPHRVVYANLGLRVPFHGTLQAERTVASRCDPETGREVRGEHRVVARLDVEDGVVIRRVLETQDPRPSALQLIMKTQPSGSRSPQGTDDALHALLRRHTPPK